jgi:hypothetical protein
MGEKGMKRKLRKTGDIHEDVRSDYYCEHPEEWDVDFRAFIAGRNVPERYVGKVASAAYQDGHSSGYGEILACAYKFMEIFE